MSRDVFITSESAELVRELIQSEGLQDGDRLFNRDCADLPRLFRKNLLAYTRKLGMGKRIPGHKYYQIHPHIFRKFFFPNAVQAIGETATHAMMGHQFYLKTYYKRHLDDIRADYRKAMPHLLVMQASSDEDLRMKLLFDQLRVFGLKDDQLRAIEDVMRRKHSFEIDGEVQAKIREFVQAAWGPTPVPRPQAAGAM